MADKSTADEEESPYLTMSQAGSPSDIVTPAMPPTSKTDERMDVDVTSLTTKETTLTTSTGNIYEFTILMTTHPGGY